MNTLFDMPAPNPKHPAKYSHGFTVEFARMLKTAKRVKDPFGGTGKIFQVNRMLPHLEIHAIEIEPEWARMNSRTIIGSALHLPFADHYFDAICTSPTYGNRMADYYQVADPKYKRISYAAFLNRPLSVESSGNLLWGEKYRAFHLSAWQEATRVICAGGVFVLNIKNHIRDGEEQFVTEWHIQTLESLGYEMVEHKKVKVPSMKFGRNAELRVPYESIIKFILKGKS